MLKCNVQGWRLLLREYLYVLRWFSPKMRDTTKAVKVEAVLVSRRQYLWFCHGCLLSHPFQFLSEILAAWLIK
jgi:hypothetical protein